MYWPVGWRGTLLAGLIAIDLGAVVWNAAVFDGLSYDERELHAPRTRNAGLGLGGRSYNPPLYYVATAPMLAGESILASLVPSSDQSLSPAKQARRADRRRLSWLRWTNVFHLAVTYFCWICIIFPRLFAERNSGVEHRRPRADYSDVALLASLWLLALPGLQKMAAMAHPDNALTSMTALLVAVYFLARDGTIKSSQAPWLLATLAGCTALTRPFGLLVAAVITVMAIPPIIYRDQPKRALARILAATAVAMLVAGSWTGYQFVRLGGLAPTYNPRHLEKYIPARASFDRLEYLQSFHPWELLHIPNRRLRTLDANPISFDNRYANSFWTLAYSETWGDHWLYFSGRYGRDDKIWAKRALLGAALPTTAIVASLGAVGITSLLRRRQRPRRWHLDAPWMILAAIAGSGLAAFLYWHLTAGLTPGKNSSVKFIYVAYLAPIIVAATVAPTRKASAWLRTWLGAYAILLFVIALPFVVYIPRVLLDCLAPS